MKTLGTIRRSDCVHCELVLASGVYLTFRLDVRTTSLNYLVEVKRERKCMRPREVILVDAHTLRLARKAALRSILAHRAKMHLPALRIQTSPRARQLSLNLR